MEWMDDDKRLVIKIEGQSLVDTVMAAHARHFR
jgi:hypothetical protein